MKKIQKKLTGWLGSVLVLTMILVFALAAYGANGTFTPNPHWKQIWEYFSGTAGENITTGAPVAYNRYDGKIYEADADDADARPAVGLAGNTAASGKSVKIVTRGILSGVSTGLGYEAISRVTPIGIPLFLSNIPGGATGVTHFNTTASGATAVPSGITQYLGTAMPLSQQASASGVTLGTDTFFINVQPPSVTTGVTTLSGVPHTGL